ncbi:hypothetical protein BGZ70_003175, partial [Mortierella alpina]
LWHLYVTQGVMFGIGASFAYYPAIAVPSQYFSKNRGLAIGIAVSGTGLGGFGLAPLTQALIERLDIFWSLRVLAVLLFVVCGVACALIKERKEVTHEVEAIEDAQETLRDQERTITPYGEGALDEGQRKDAEARKPSFFQSLHVFKDPRFMSLTLAEFTASLGYLIPLYFMQTYAVFIGLTPEQGALIIGISNGSAFVGRIALGVIADKFSNTKALLFCCWASAISVMVFWTIAKSFGTLLLMGVSFNLFIGAYVSLVPVAVAESFGTETMASMIGLMYGAGGLAMWGGSPLAGYILDSTRPNVSYTPVIMTAGGSLVLGALCVTSWAYFNWRANRLVYWRSPRDFSPERISFTFIVAQNVEEILMAACREDNLDMLENVLSADSSNFNINHTDGQGNSALHYAALYASTGCLEILLYYDGIKVNVINKLEGDTPLHKAAAYQDPEIALEMVQILVNGGAKSNIKNKNQQTAADIAPGDTHADVKKFLEVAALSSLVDSRDIPDDDSDGSNDVASDDD